MSVLTAFSPRGSFLNPALLSAWYGISNSDACKNLPFSFPRSFLPAAKAVVVAPATARVAAIEIVIKNFRLDLILINSCLYFIAVFSLPVLIYN